MTVSVSMVRQKLKMMLIQILLGLHIQTDTHTRICTGLQINCETDIQMHINIFFLFVLASALNGGQITSKAG